MRAVAAVATRVSWPRTSTQWWPSTAPRQWSAPPRNLGQISNAAVVRADLRRAPFADGCFGFIASFGVLHHLEDPRAGFDRLLRLLAPGGVLSLYLYSRPEEPGARGLGLAAARVIRRLTVRLPHRTLRSLCTPIAALLSVSVVTPGRVGDALGIRRLSALPMGTYRDKPFRSLVLDTFDRLSAPVEHRFTWAELAPWFDESGLVVDSARATTRAGSSLPIALSDVVCQRTPPRRRATP